MDYGLGIKHRLSITIMDWVYNTASDINVDFELNAANQLQFSFVLTDHN